MRPGCVPLIATILLLLSACSDNAGPEQAGGEASGTVQFALPWTPGETWFFVGGPHCDSAGDDCGEQPRYALDFAPEAPMFGNLCVPSVIETHWVTSAAPGTVRVAERSLVEIEHEDGLRTGYYHLLTSSIPVEVGDQVERGTRLGHPSCEHLRGGGSRGPHVHFYICRADGADDECLGDQHALLSAEGQELSGWRVAAGDKNYDGTLERGGERRQAINERCDRSEEATEACDGTRNDLLAE